MCIRHVWWNLFLRGMADLARRPVFFFQIVIHPLPYHWDQESFLRCDNFSSRQIYGTGGPNCSPLVLTGVMTSSTHIIIYTTDPAPPSNTGYQSEIGSMKPVYTPVQYAKRSTSNKSVIKFGLTKIVSKS